MTTYQVGQTVTRAVTVKDLLGALANVTGSVTCTVTLPDATTGSATVTNPSTGSYLASYATTASGQHRFTWYATGTNSGGFPYTDVVDVWPENPRFLIGLDEARDALNLAATNTTHDDEIRRYLAAATPVIEDLAGPILPATHTYTTDGGQVAIALPHAPITAVTSVSEGGTALAATAYEVDTESGIVEHASDRFTAGVLNVEVVYTVGSATVAPNVVLAARELVRHLYQIGQQANRPSFGGEEVAYTPSGFAVPRRVVELLGTSANRPGLA